MSWSGFKKAVNRAGAHVILKTNKTAEATVDPEFDLQESNFKKLESYTFELDVELNRFVTNCENLAETQINMAKTLDSFYGDYSFDLESDKKPGIGEGAAASVNNRDGISLEYLKIVEEVKESVLPELLEPMNVTVIEPINELKRYNEEIGRLIKKRGRKKVDYDVVKFRLNKLQNDYDLLEFQVKEQQLQEKNEQLNRSQEKYKKLKVEYDEAETIYNDINTRLKNEIEQFVALRLSLIDPTFESFIKIQLKLYSDIYNRLELNPSVRLDSMSVEEHNEEKIDARLDEILMKMKSLNIKNL